MARGKGTHTRSREGLTQLVARLGEWNDKVRVQARDELARLGSAAVPVLVRALASRKPLIRWEAAEILRVLRDGRASEALVRALTDSQHQIRWIATEALVEIGRSCLGPLYSALVHDEGSQDLRSGARFVLYELNRRGLLREADLLVYEILREMDSPGTSVVAAFHALQHVRGPRNGRLTGAAPRSVRFDRSAPPVG